MHIKSNFAKSVQFHISCECVVYDIYAHILDNFLHPPIINIYIERKPHKNIHINNTAATPNTREKSIT